MSPKIQLAYLATLKAPVFELLPSQGRVFSAIFSKLAVHGAKLSDIRAESVGPTLNDVSVTCALSGSGVLVRYRLDGVEVWTEQQPGDFPHLAAAAMEALTTASPEAAIASHSTVLLTHANVPTDRLTNVLTGAIAETFQAFETPLRASGVSLTAALPNDGTGTIVVEPSASLKGMTFLRVTSQYPGSVSPFDVCNRGAEFFASALKALVNVL